MILNFKKNLNISLIFILEINKECIIVVFIIVIVLFIKEKNQKTKKNKLI